MCPSDDPVIHHIERTTGYDAENYSSDLPHDKDDMTIEEKEKSCPEPTSKEIRP